MAMIEVKDLRKEYRVNRKKEGLKGAVLSLFHPQYETIIAVNNINFNIDAGEMVGYIGANGAGKSTTIKMLTGVLTPTSGSLTVNGLIPYKNRVKNNLGIGAVFGQRTQLWWDIPVIESFKLIGKMYEMPKEDFRRNLTIYSELLDLKNLLGIPVRQLSLGQKMRCEIAAAFLHNPAIVYLDEPTIGLDITVKDKIRHFIKTLNRTRLTTVILTTHDLQDIEEICNRIIIIDNGRIAYDGSLTEIRTQFGKQRAIKFKVKNISENLFPVLAAQKEYLTLIFHDNYEIDIEFNRQLITASGIMDIVSKYCEVLDMSIKEPSVESIVRELYQKRG